MNKFLTSSSLKLLAITFMLIDHIGATNTYVLIGLNDALPLRIIGRLAFPIFAFLIAEGYFHTHNKQKYLYRLIIFAFISEIPFDLAFNLGLEHQNVFLTLALGLLSIILFEKYEKRDIALSFLLVVFIAFISILLSTDYSAFGVFMIFSFYYFRDNFFKSAISLIIINLLMAEEGISLLLKGIINLEYLAQIFAIFALVFIYFYNNKKGKNLKYLFYFFYPVHLIILYFINLY